MTATQRPSPPASEGDEFEDARDGDLTPPSTTAALPSVAKDAAPATSSATRPRPTPFDLDRSTANAHAYSVPPSETGDTPMATAPTSPLSPFSPTTPTSSTKPRLGGRGVPPRAGETGRSVSQTMARAYAEMAAEQGASAEAAASGSAAGTGADTRRVVDEGEEADDEWVNFVRSQLVRLFPDFHSLDDGSGPALAGADAVPGGEGEEGEGGAPQTFRAELMAMRTEIGVLRGIVAELTAAHPGAAELIRQRAQAASGGRGEVKSGLEAAPEPKEQPKVAESTAKDSDEKEPKESTSVQSKQPELNGAKEKQPESTVSDSNGINGTSTKDASPAQLDAATLDLALSVVRVLDAAAHGPARTDSDVFAHTNLRTLLALAFARSPVAAETGDKAAHSHHTHHGHHVHKSTHAHDHLNAHEEIEKMHDVAITPEIGTPPSPKTPPCAADDMSDEELDELAELAEEAHGLVS